MLPLLCPEGYRPLLDELTTEKAIRKIKDEFQNNLAFELKEYTWHILRYRLNGETHWKKQAWGRCSPVWPFRKGSAFQAIFVAIRGK